MLKSSHFDKSIYIQGTMEFQNTSISRSSSSWTDLWVHFQQNVLP